MKKTCNYYAVRFGNVVEIRAALKPPKAIVSKLTKTVMVEESVYVPAKNGEWYGKFVLKQVPKKVILSQTFYDGGRVLGVVKLNHFQIKAQEFGVKFERGTDLLEISKELRMVLKEKMIGV